MGSDLSVGRLILGQLIDAVSIKEIMQRQKGLTTVFVWTDAKTKVLEQGTSK
jgi:hypothetical protein